MDKPAFRADSAASRVLLLVPATTVPSKLMTVCSAGGGMILGKAVFRTDSAVSRVLLLSTLTPVQSKLMTVYSAGE